MQSGYTHISSFICKMSVAFHCSIQSDSCPNHSDRTGSTDSLKRSNLKESPPEFKSPSLLREHKHGHEEIFPQINSGKNAYTHEIWPASSNVPKSCSASANVNISGPLLCIWLRKRNIKTNVISKHSRTVFPSRKTPREEAAACNVRCLDTSRENRITVDDSSKGDSNANVTEIGLEL